MKLIVLQGSCKKCKRILFSVTLWKQPRKAWKLLTTKHHQNLFVSSHKFSDSIIDSGGVSFEGRNEREGLMTLFLTIALNELENRFKERDNTVIVASLQALQE